MEMNDNDPDEWMEMNDNDPDEWMEMNDPFRVDVRRVGRACKLF
jgi:hypothetical protein